MKMRFKSRYPSRKVIWSQVYLSVSAGGSSYTTPTIMKSISSKYNS